MTETSLEIKHLRNRFVSDLNLPIPVVQSPYFEERLELLEEEYGALTSYKNLLLLIDKQFNRSINEFLESYHTIRDNIITSVINSEAYKDFISNDKFNVNVKPICSNRNLYTQEQDGGLFVSYDMKKANFQALKYANPSIVYDADTYEDFIGKFTDLDYIKESKYTRQVIFGKMNPKRTIALEKWITNEFTKSLFPLLTNTKLSLFSLNSDEIILKFEGSEEEFEKLELEPYKVFQGVEYKLSKFKLHSRQFKLATSSSLLTVYEKEDYLNAHKRILKGIPATYYPQVYKLLNGMKINDSDLVFYYEHELCKFLYPLEIVK